MRIFLFILFFCIKSSIAQGYYNGQWRITGGSIIEIYNTGAVFEGKIIKRSFLPLYNSNGLDNKNPIPELRNQTIVGLVILKNLYFKNKALSGGTIYNADTGKTNAVKLMINEDNINTCFVEISKNNKKSNFKIKRVLKRN